MLSYEGAVSCISDAFDDIEIAHLVAKDVVFLNAMTRNGSYWGPCQIFEITMNIFDDDLIATFCFEDSQVVFALDVCDQLREVYMNLEYPTFFPHFESEALDPLSFSFDFTSYHTCTINGLMQADFSEDYATFQLSERSSGLGGGKYTFYPC